MIYYSVHLAGHESKPLQNITDTLLAVRSSKDTIDTILDAGSVPALVPGTFNLSFAHDDLVQSTGKLVLELGISWLSRGNSQDMPSSRTSFPVDWTRSSCAKERLKVPGTSAGTLPASRIVSMVSLELLTASSVSVMFWSGLDSWPARWTE